MIAGVPNRQTPAGAPEWLAELIEYAVAQYSDPRSVPLERFKWVTARLLAASSLLDARQKTILIDILSAPRAKNGGAR
jgi:hypothetical protein